MHSFLGFLIGLLPTFLGLYANFFWQVCQNSSLSVHRIVFMGSIFFEKNNFPFVFHFLGRKFSGLQQKYSSTVIRTALVSKFFNRIYANFVSDFTQVLLAGLSELHCTCPQDCFHGKHLLWKKHFSICISHFRLKFFRFSAKIFQRSKQNCIGF